MTDHDIVRHVEMYRSMLARRWRRACEIARIRERARLPLTDEEVDRDRAVAVDVWTHQYWPPDLLKKILRASS